MSIELHVFYGSKHGVSLKQWNEEIRALGYDVVLDEGINLNEFSGFLPVMHKNSEAGFEYYRDEPTRSELSKMGVPLDLGVQVTFRTGSSSQDLACSSVAAAALCRLTRGVIYEPQEGVIVSHAECAAWLANEYQATLRFVNIPLKKRKMSATDYVDRFLPQPFKGAISEAVASG